MGSQAGTPIQSPKMDLYGSYGSILVVAEVVVVVIVVIVVIVVDAAAVVVANDGWCQMLFRDGLQKTGGLNFINILRTAFTLVDPKSVKKYS